MVSGEHDLKVDIEAGRSDVMQESTSDIVSANGAWSERVDFGVSEKLVDDLNYPLMGNENPAETSSQSLDLSEKKCDNVKIKKSRKASKPPRPPKGPSLSANDHKVMREIAELAMRKRARIERMKNSLKRIKAAKSSSSSQCISIFSMIVTVLFFVFLVFQGTNFFNFLVKVSSFVLFSTLDESIIAALILKLQNWFPQGMNLAKETALRFSMVLDWLLFRHFDVNLKLSN